VGRKLNVDNDFVIAGRGNVYSHRLVIRPELRKAFEALTGNAFSGPFEKSGYVAITPSALEFWQEVAETKNMEMFLSVSRGNISGVDYGRVSDGWNGQPGLVVHVQSSDGVVQDLPLLLLNTGWITLPDRKTGLLPIPAFLSEWQSTAT
jgi:hypothetical protein